MNSGSENGIKQKFISSAFLLMISTIIVKVISAVYKIPLTAYIGATGRGCFSIAYNLCLPIHALTMGAFPIAVTKLVSTSNANGNEKKVRALQLASRRLFLLIGIVGMAIMLIASKPYAEIISSSSKSIYTIIALAPSILFSTLCVSHRAFAEGHLDMKATAISQVLEAFVKMIFGLLFARWGMSALYQMYINNGVVLGYVPASEEEALSFIYPLTSALAMLGVTLGSLVSWIFARIYISINYKNTIKDKLDIKGAYSDIVIFALPLIVATAIQGASTFIDTASIQYCLSKCDSTILSSIYNRNSNDIYTYVFGVYSSVLDFKNLVPSIVMTLGVTAVPAVSIAYESSSERFSSLVTSILKYTVLLAVIGGAALCLMSNELLTVFYGKNNPDIVSNGSQLLFWQGVAILPPCLASTTVFIAQSLGYSRDTIAPFAISAIIRVILNFILVPNERLNLLATAISSFVGFTIIFVWNLITITKRTNVKIDGISVLVKPILCSVIVYFSINAIKNNIDNSLGFYAKNVIVLLLFIAILTLLSFLLKIISISDLKMLK